MLLSFAFAFEYGILDKIFCFMPHVALVHRGAFQMATIKDIAKRSGLGLATISKYINGGNVKEKNRIAIEAAINELGFTVNEYARGLRTNRSRTIGVVIPELSNIFITTILSTVEDILRNSGYSMIVSDCRTDEDRERQAVQFMLNKHVDGIINMPVSNDGSHLRPAIDKNIPVVLIDRMIHGLQNQVNAVLVDNIKASEDATQMLIQAGHSSIGIILGPENIFTSQQRLLGYNQAFIHNNMIPQERYIQFSDYTTQGGYESAMSLLSHEKPSALFVTNYEMTLGTIIAINDLHLSIPVDLALIGFDNMQLSKVIKPKLTTVSQPLEEIASVAAEILITALNKDEPNQDFIIKTLTTQVLAGDSV